MNQTPSEYLNLPVIGKIWCKLNLSTSDGKAIETPVDEFDVIKIIDKGDVKVYMCNQWNSYLEPQLVADVCVIRFEEKQPFPLTTTFNTHKLEVRTYGIKFYHQCFR